MRLRRRNRFSKGQGTIASVFLFFVGVTFTIFILGWMSAIGPTDSTYKIKVDRQTSDVKKKSVVAVTMNDFMWRSPDIDPAKYDNMMANRVISYYFSTEGDRLCIGETMVTKSEMKEDLENYLEFKMDRHWIEGSDPTDYWLEIEHKGEKIVVKDAERYPDAQWDRAGFKIALMNGETANAVLWTRKPGGKS